MAFYRCKGITEKQKHDRYQEVLQKLHAAHGGNVEPPDMLRGSKSRNSDTIGIRSRIKSNALLKAHGQSQIRKFLLRVFQGSSPLCPRRLFHLEMAHVYLTLLPAEILLCYCRSEFLSAIMPTPRSILYVTAFFLCPIASLTL